MMKTLCSLTDEQCSEIQRASITAANLELQLAYLLANNYKATVDNVTTSAVFKVFSEYAIEERIKLSKLVAEVTSTNNIVNTGALQWVLDATNKQLVILSK